MKTYLLAVDGEARRVLAQRREEQESRVPHTCGSQTPRSNAFLFSQKTGSLDPKTAVIYFPMYSIQTFQRQAKLQNHSTLSLPPHRTVFYRNVWTDWRTKKGRNMPIASSSKQPIGV